MPHSGCSALHGVNPNLKIKKKKKTIGIIQLFLVGNVSKYGNSRLRPQPLRKSLTES